MLTDVQTGQTLAHGLPEWTHNLDRSRVSKGVKAGQGDTEADGPEPPLCGEPFRAQA